VRAVLGEHPHDLCGVECEVGRALPLDDRRSRHPGDLCVHLVRRLESRDPAPVAPVREQQRLQHLVRAVGCEDLRRIDRVRGGDRLAEFGRRPVGVAVPVDA
jgi:hypothetical protein